MAYAPTTAPQPPDPALPQAVQQAVAAVPSLAPKQNPTFTGTVQGLTKDFVGLSNVDNTSDVSKPVSTAQSTAIAKVKTDLLDGVADEGNTLKKLYALLLAVKAILGDSADTDTVVSTVQEVLAVMQNFPEGVNLLTRLAGMDAATAAALTQAQQPFNLVVGSYITGLGTDASPLDLLESALTTLIQKYTIASTSFDSTTGILTLTMGNGSTRTQSIMASGTGSGSTAPSTTPPAGNATQDAMRVAGVGITSGGGTFNGDFPEEGLSAIYDGDPTTQMVMTTTSGQDVSTANPVYVQHDAGAGKTINPASIKLQGIKSGAGDFGPRITDFEFLGSNDATFASGSVSLLKVTANNMGFQTLTEFALTTFGAYRYHRLVCTKTVPTTPNGSKFVMATMQIMVVPAT